MNKSVCAAAMALASTAAVADSFTFEAAGRYADSDSAGEGYAVDASYFPGGVDVGDRPRIEAPFLNRATRATLVYADQTDADTQSYRLEVEKWFGDFYVAIDGEYLDSNVDETEGYGANIGFMVGENFRYAVRYAENAAFDAEEVAFLARAYVGTGNGRGIAVNANMTFIDDAASTAKFGGALDYYFNQNLSLGLLATHIDNDAGSDQEYGARASFFVTPSIFVEADYKTTGDSDDDIYGGRVGMRF